MSRMKFYAISVIMMVAFQCCTVGTTGVWRNENINATDKTEIKSLNEKLINAISENDFNALRSLMSDSLKKMDLKQLNTFMVEVKGEFDRGYRILDEYQASNSGGGIFGTAISEATGDNAYTFKFRSLTKNTYISFILPNDRLNELLLTVIYGKYDDEWKINILNFGQYGYLDKNGPGLFTLAKASYEKAYLIDAVNYISMARQCIKPAGNLFSYTTEAEILAFHDKVLAEANTKYKFPFTFDMIPTRPILYGIHPRASTDGFVPVVDYISVIPQHDTVALRKEYEEIRVQVTAMFLGIDKDKTLVFYQANSGVPDGKTEVKRYGFIQKLKSPL